MGQISLQIPQIGQPDTTEDVKVANGLSTIQGAINGNIDSTNITAGLAQSAGVNASGQTVKGSSIIATGQTTGSTSFTTLATPDQVAGIVLPVAGLLVVYYRAVWSNTVSAAASAAIFLNSNQLQVDFGGAAPVTDLTTGPGTASTANGLTTTATGLNTSNSGTSQTANDVTTGQTLSSGGQLGGPCTIFAAAGSYTVSIQFKVSSGTVSVSNRRLYVQALSFA